MNVDSMGRMDEIELERLLKELDLRTNIFPVFSRPESLYKATQAVLVRKVVQSSLSCTSPSSP